jgi:hypothetical protein
MKKLGLVLATLLVAMVFAACSAPLDLVDYRADLSPANEVPPVTGTTAEGFVDFELRGNELSIVDNTAINLSSAVTGAHIHTGCTGENGGVLFPIEYEDDPDAAGIAIKMSGTFTLTTAQITQLNNDCLYVNVHTENNPGGEIRGQIDGLLE